MKILSHTKSSQAYKLIKRNKSSYLLFKAFECRLFQLWMFMRREVLELERCLMFNEWRDKLTAFGSCHNYIFISFVCLSLDNYVWLPQLRLETQTSDLQSNNSYTLHIFNLIYVYIYVSHSIGHGMARCTTSQAVKSSAIINKCLRVI